LTVTSGYHPRVWHLIGSVRSTLTFATRGWSAFVASNSRGAAIGSKSKTTPLMPLSHVQRLPTSCARLRSSTANDEGVARAPPLGFQCPTTHEARRSYQRRAYLTRLCCACRFSQPLDALFRSTPFRPCFVPVTPLGFERFQRVSPTGSGKGFSSHPVLHAVSMPCPEGHEPCSSEDVRTRWIRSSRGGVTRWP